LRGHHGSSYENWLRIEKTGFYSVWADL